MNRHTSEQEELLRDAIWECDDLDEFYDSRQYEEAYEIVEEICGQCCGSGEGQYEGSLCWNCYGEGIEEKKRYVNV